MSYNTTSDTASDVTYTFDYDGLGRKTTVKVSDQILSTNVYENNRNGLLSEEGTVKSYAQIQQRHL